MVDGLTNRRAVLATIGSSTLAGLAGCTGSDGGSSDSNSKKSTPKDRSKANAQNVLKVGVLLPFTGEYDWVGASIFPVAQMVAEEVNNAGGINGKQIQLVKGDTEASVDAAVTATKKLINVDKVRAFIGPTSLTYTGTLDLFQQNKVATVSPTGSTVELNDVGGEYQFRTVPSDTLGGRAIALAARKKKYNGIKAYKRMGIMSGKAPALQSFKGPVSQSFKEFGGTIVKNMDFATGKSSYQSEVSKMLNADPEIITLVGTPEDSAKILRAAFQAGYQGNWFFTQDQTNQDFLNSVDTRLTNGRLGLKDTVSPKAKEEGRVEQFYKDFKEFSGKEPGFFAENTYDAMNIVALAMKATATAGDDLSTNNIANNIPTIANPPGKTVRNYVEGADALDGGSEINYSGLVGPMDFDENGNVLAPFEILKANEGKWETASVIPAKALSK